MSGPIAVRLGDELEDRFDSYHESRSGDHKKSDTFRYLLNEGLRAEELPLYNRLGVEDREGEPNPVGAQLEAARQATEKQEDVVRRFLAEAVEARQADVLDELEVDDELRDRVEAVREEGETLDDAVRRLVRQGAEVSTPAGEKRETARNWAEMFAIMFILSVLAFSPPGDFLNRTLPIVSITGEQAITVVLALFLVFYLTKRVSAWIDRRSREK